MEHHSTARAHYVATATHRFAADGYHGASLAAIARDASVTKQAFLHFFGTKEQLYTDVLTELAKRLVEGLEDARCPDPAEHLLQYFLALRSTSESSGQDMRLVVRALLDSSETAHRWPLKVYIDQLLSLAAQTPGGKAVSEEYRLAWISQMIGMIQYRVISTPTVAGMYSKTTAAKAGACFDTLIAEAVVSFARPKGV